MAKIENLKSLEQKLRQLSRRYLKSPNATKESVAVGYTAAYALYVHEMDPVWRGRRREGKHPDGSEKKGRYWDPQGRGQNKFLETPAREKQKVIGDVIVKAANRGAKLQQALYLGGLLLQRESQLLVPVDTGNLKGSAFTVKE